MAFVRVYTNGCVGGLWGGVRECGEEEEFNRRSWEWVGKMSVVLDG